MTIQEQAPQVITEEEMLKLAPNASKETVNLASNGDAYVWHEGKEGYQNLGHVSTLRPTISDGAHTNEIPVSDVLPEASYHSTPAHIPSAEEQREAKIVNKAHPSLDDVSTLLEGALQKLEGEESDAAFKALDALKKVRVDLRRKRRNTWLRWLLFWAIVGGVVYGLYKWIPTQVVSGRYTVPKVCSAPFGPGLIQGMRYYNYTYKSLFGVHFTLESTVREETDVTKNGQEFTIFGLSPRNEAATEEEMALADKVLKAAEVEVEGVPKPPKGKWWRINVWSSDKGTQWMKPAELYLFASEKYTTLVAYKDFCK
jgi:hypothetical protein